MKTLKKTVSILLTILLSLSALCVTAVAASGSILLSGEAGENVHWSLTDDGVLTVTGNGPIEDEIEYDYDDDGEVISWQTLNSIAITLSDYFGEQVEKMDVAATEHFRINLVREIIVEEGITAIPDGEFDGFYPRKVSLPATLEELGYQAFDASFAEEVVIRSALLPYAQFTVAGFREDEEPYADIDSAIEGYVAQRIREEQFHNDSLPIYALQELFSLEKGLLEESEEDIAYMYEYYNEAFGSQTTTPDELAAVAITLLNRHFGTNFTGIDDIFHIEENEWGTDTVWSEELQTAYETETDSIFEDGRIIQTTLGDELDEGEQAYGWLKVTAPADSAIQEACKITGVSFVDINEGLCKFCHKDHSGNIWQKLLGFFHKIFYFFARLFARLK